MEIEISSNRRFYINGNNRILMVISIFYILRSTQKTTFILEKRISLIIVFLFQVIKLFSFFRHYRYFISITFKDQASCQITGHIKLVNIFSIGIVLDISYNFPQIIKIAISFIGHPDSLFGAEIRIL